jgi:hypothetical protein
MDTEQAAPVGPRRDAGLERVRRATCYQRYSIQYTTTPVTDT